MKSGSVNDSAFLSKSAISGLLDLTSVIFVQKSLPRLVDKLSTITITESSEELVSPTPPPTMKVFLGVILYGFFIGDLMALF